MDKMRLYSISNKTPTARVQNGAYFMNIPHLYLNFITYGIFIANKDCVTESQARKWTYC